MPLPVKASSKAVAALVSGGRGKANGNIHPGRLDASVDQQQTRDPLFKMAQAGVPVTERVFAQNWLRPPFIQPYRCSRVLVEGVTIRNSPFWLLNPVLCTDVIVRQVNFFSHGPNSDGCDPESCNRVLISDCLFDTGDDCIALNPAVTTTVGA